jgi:hypothetical protein
MRHHSCRVENCTKPSFMRLHCYSLALRGVYIKLYYKLAHGNNGHF